MSSFNVAYSSLLALIGVLGFIFLFLLSYTLWTRAKKRYWQRYKQKFRDYFSPMLFEFVEGDPGPSDADALIKNLTKRTQDVRFFLELMDEMTELLKGKGREKLDLLIEHELFYEFYRDRLFSFSTSNKLLACSYFESISSINDRISARLISLSKSWNLKLAYGATKALQSSDNKVVRRNALIRFLRRDDISELMVSELLHLFNDSDNWAQEEISNGLKTIFFQQDIKPQNKRIVVLYLAYKNHYELGSFLLQYLQKLQYSSYKAPLFSGLIEAIGKLHVTKAASIIRSYIEIQNLELRLKCVEALGRLGGEENLVFLMQRLLNAEFPVRKKIIQVMTQDRDTGIALIDQFLIENQKFIAQFKQQTELPEDLKEIVQNIYSTVRGIKIMLPKEMAGDHV